MYDKPSVKTLIIYNYSKTEVCMFEFINPGFNMKDDLAIDPPKGKIEPNSHMIIKLKLTPKNYLSSYEGEIEIKIIWNTGENKANRFDNERDNLFVRIIKASLIKEVRTKFI